MTPETTLRALAGAKAWPDARVSALSGRCRGVLLRDWGVHVRSAFGETALADVRAALGLDATELPDSPAHKAWVPVQHQLRATRAIAARCLGGDLLALEPLLAEAGTRARDRVVEWAARRAGPGLILKSSPRIHRHLYDAGEVVADVGRDRAELNWRGAAFFAEPTWRLLQCFALRTTFTLLRRELTTLAVGADDEEAGFRLRLAWR